VVQFEFPQDSNRVRPLGNLGMANAFTLKTPVPRSVSVIASGC
jgi:hypothetical protein